MSWAWDWLVAQVANLLYRRLPVGGAEGVPHRLLILLAFLTFTAGACGATIRALPYNPLRPPKLLRGPYLQLGTPSSVIIRWRTEELSTSVVRYGPTPANAPFAEVATGLTKEHVVQLSGLTPNTRYYYSIGATNWILSGGDSSHFFVTSPVRGSSRPTRIWVLGDSGTRSLYARAVRDSSAFVMMRPLSGPDTRTL